MTVTPMAFGPEEQALFAGLDDHPPAKPFKPVAGHAADNRPRSLSEPQLNVPLLRLAAERIVEEARNRGQRWLRRIDDIHGSGCRTKQQRWDALAAMAEPILARINLANLCLGWYDDDGRFRLNRQRGIAQDANLSEACVSRTFATLEAAGYVIRTSQRIFKHGKHWVTRTIIRLRRRFFVDLCLTRELAKAMTWARKKRDRKLSAAKSRQAKQAEQNMAAAAIRKQSHRKAQDARKAKVVKLEEARAQDRQRSAGELAMQIAIDNPDLSPSEHLKLLRQLLNKP